MPEYPRWTRSEIEGDLEENLRKGDIQAAASSFLFIEGIASGYQTSGPNVDADERQWGADLLVNLLTDDRIARAPDIGPLMATFMVTWQDMPRSLRKTLITRVFVKTVATYAYYVAPLGMFETLFCRYLPPDEIGEYLAILMQSDCERTRAYTLIGLGYNLDDMSPSTVQTVGVESVLDHALSDPSHEVRNIAAELREQLRRR